MHRLLFIVLAVLSLAGRVAGEEIVLSFEGEVPDSEEAHFFLPFEVPPGVAEIEVRHDDLSEANILDWGLDDAAGFRGWGGGNREPAVVGLDAASRSYVPGPIHPGVWEVVVGKAKIVERPARYAVDVILRDTPTLTPQTERSPYVAPAPISTTARWYAGDFHVHSRESGDAQPSIDRILQFAAGRGLDFVMLSEHNTNSQLTLYNAAQARSPQVLLLPGVEFTTYAGHANGIGALAWVDHRIGVRGATIEAAIRSFHEQGALFSINHPNLRLGDACIGCAWDHDVDPREIDAVEVRTGVVSAVSFWESLVSRGSYAAAIGGSDDHSAGMADGLFDSPIGSPTTMVYAAELSVDAILNGVREGRTVVKMAGPDAPMIETELGGERVGKTVYATESILRATVTAGNGRTLRLIKNGRTIEETPIGGDPFVYEVSVQAPMNGEDRYRFAVVDGSTVDTVASYVWLQAANPTPSPSPSPSPSPDSAGNEGCTLVSPATAGPPPMLPLLAPLLAWAVRRLRGSARPPANAHCESRRARECSGRARVTPGQC